MKRCTILVMCVLFACDTAPQRVQGVFAPLGEPMPSATPEQLEAFDRGREAMLRRFTPEDGLGPHFNVTFCGACHEKPVFGGSGGRYRNFSIVGNKRGDEFRFTGVSVTTELDTSPTGVLPQFTSKGRFPTDEFTNHSAARNPIPFFGAGLIAELPEASIRANEDPDDADGDGISGRINIDRGFVGRFGRKSQTTSLEGFIRGPLFNHLGITSAPLSNEMKLKLPIPSGVVEEPVEGAIGSSTQLQVAAASEPNFDDDGVPDPELSEQELFDLVSLVMLMAPPEPAPLEGQALQGAVLFEQAQCTGCHVPNLEGPRGLVPLYSDLLIHDMGEEMADGIQMLEASGSEYRTQPLWGVAAGSPYLHDGRADTLDEAIRAHGGEATASRAAYLGLTAAKQTAVIAFLNSLGGAEQRSEGLLPPDAPIPEQDYGASLGGVSDDVFVSARGEFDRDVFFESEGLGPVFNGDACRACHFDPVIGGSGPSDVDVIRHGTFNIPTMGQGEFVEPDFGTISHRHATDGSRPAFADSANIVERRNTPALFGMGLIDAIPTQALMDRADPDDMDGDGISGRVHILSDGRVGRLGWKADIPNLVEFARDAASAELGMTVPPVAGLTFGTLADDDEVSDPEITLERLSLLTTFMEQLAPPPRRSSDATAEQDGQQLFDAVGCMNCHSNYVLEDGTEVNLFSDLLLHDVAEDDFVGVPSGDATMREFRTAPLWGISESAPYMHAGSAVTVEQAIAEHASEGAASRQAYEALSANERAALLAFLKSL